MTEPTTARPSGRRPRGVWWRLIRRELADHRLRTLLTVILVAIPVWVVTHQAVTALNNVQTTEKLMPYTVGSGSAYVEPLVSWVSSIPVGCPQSNSLGDVPKMCESENAENLMPERGNLSELAPAGTRLLPRYWSDARGMTCHGWVGSSTWTEQPGNWTLRVIPDGMPAGDIGLSEGRLPNADDEIALGNVCADVGVKVGDVVSGGGSSWTVVGIADGSDVTVNQGHSLAATAGDFARYTSWQLFTDHRFTEADVEAFNAQGWFLAAKDLMGAQSWTTTAESDAWGYWVRSMLAMAIGSVVLATLVAVGFVLAARHRRHQMTLLSATGASDRDLVSLTVAHGLLVGGAGVVAGVLLGLVSGIALMALSSEPIRVPWLRVLGFAAFSWLVSGLAALGPAWGVATFQAEPASGAPRVSRFPRLSMLHSGLVVAAWPTTSALFLTIPGWPHVILHRDGVPWWVNLLAIVLVSSVLAAVVSMPRAWLWLLDRWAAVGPVWWRLGLRELAERRARTWAALAAGLCMGGSYWPLLLMETARLNHPFSSATPGFLVATSSLALLMALATAAVTVVTFSDARTTRAALAAAGLAPRDAARSLTLVALAPVAVGFAPALALTSAAAWCFWFSLSGPEWTRQLMVVMSAVTLGLSVMAALVASRWCGHRRTHGSSPSNPSPHPERNSVS